MGARVEANGEDTALGEVARQRSTTVSSYDAMKSNVPKPPPDSHLARNRYQSLPPPTIPSEVPFSSHPALGTKSPLHLHRPIHSRSLQSDPWASSRPSAIAVLLTTLRRASTTQAETGCIFSNLQDSTSRCQRYVLMETAKRTRRRRSRFSYSNPLTTSSPTSTLSSPSYATSSSETVSC